MNRCCPSDKSAMAGEPVPGKTSLWCGGEIDLMTERARTSDRVHELAIALANDDAFESWYLRTVPRVYSYLLGRCGNDPTLAEELTQQTFIAAVAQRSRYDGRADSVTWLCGIARHKLADHFRAQERDERRRMRLEVRQIPMVHGAGGTSASDERLAIADAFRSLPAAQRAVLTFVVLDDLPVAEVASLLGRSAGATQSLLHRARDAFRQAYRGEPE
jgi:RNA polymerase sigma-70 factor (ECF subfamily)